MSAHIYFFIIGPTSRTRSTRAFFKAKVQLHIMASAVARVYLGVWGHSPQWDPGAKPLVGVRGQSPPEANEF